MLDAYCQGRANEGTNNIQAEQSIRNRKSAEGNLIKQKQFNKEMFLL